MIETSSDLPQKSFATSAIFELSKSVLKNVRVTRESIGEYLKIRNVYAYIMNKTMYVACRYGVYFLKFDFLVQLSGVSCAHS